MSSSCSQRMMHLETTNWSHNVSQITVRMSSWNVFINVTEIEFTLSTIHEYTWCYKSDTHQNVYPWDQYDVKFADINCGHFKSSDMSSSCFKRMMHLYTTYWEQNVGKFLMLNELTGLHHTMYSICLKIYFIKSIHGVKIMAVYLGVVSNEQTSFSPYRVVVVVTNRLNLRRRA